MQNLLKSTLIFLLICASSKNFAQFVNPPAGEIFRDDLIPRVDIILDADSLAYILDDENLESNYHFRATFIFNNGTISDTLEEVGFRLRGNTSRGAAKKSFKISFNTYSAGRRFFGLKKMNLNGQHNDPSVARAKICADLADDFGIPSMRSNHVELYINGEYFGLYINVEHIDEVYVKSRFGNQDGNLYKCLYPADLKYLGENPDLYKAESFGRRAYQLRSNEAADDYSDFANFVDILNNTPLTNLPCELEQVFNVDQYLKIIAFDILVGNWDGPIYNKNNFYLYHNLATGQFEYIPFDLDNTLGIDWLSRDWGNRDIYAWKKTDEARPIYTKILSVSEYRDRFSFYLNEMIANHFNSTNLFPYLDEMRTKLYPFVEDDVYYTLNYGFSIQDFTDAFEMTLPYFQTDYGIKPFIETRAAAALQQLELNDIAPLITNIYNNNPTLNQPIKITAQVRDNDAVGQVQVCYFTTSPADLTCVDLTDEGMNGDTLAGDGIYGIEIQGLSEPKTFYYEILATDLNSNISNAPTCDYKTIHIGDSTIPLAINEILASNASTNSDTHGDFDDWIEIYNYGNYPIYLGDKFLSDKMDNPNKWALPQRIILPQEYLLVWADDDESQGDFHSNFKLSAGGEFIGIFNSASNDFSLIDGLEFDAQNPDISWGRLPNGTGDFQTLNPSPQESNIVLAQKSISKNFAVEIFPNPFEQKIQIVLPSENQEIFTLEIVDAFGRSFFQNPNFSHSSIPILNLPTLPQGLYFLILKNEVGEIFSQKIIKR